MKQINFNGGTYNIPQSWKDVSVRQQIKAYQIESEEAYVKNLGLIAAYTGIDVALLRKAKIEEVKSILYEMAFLNEDIKAEPVFEFEYGGEKYYVTPNILDVEFQDYVAAQTAVAEYKDNYWKQITYLLAINAKKEGETLDDFDINKRAEYFEDIDVETVSGIAAFFLSNQRLLDFITQSSSKESLNSAVLEKVKELQNTLKTLRKQRGGNLLIKLWISISRKYIKSLNLQWEKYYNSLP